MLRHSNREQRGVNLVEFAASMAFGLPLVMTMLYCTVEANLLFSIRTNMDLAVREWAQLAINAYETSSSTATAQSTANSSFPGIPHFVAANNSNGQIQPTWDTAQRPRTLTVTCSYPTAGDSANGLMPFPNPDPLNLKRNIGFTISATGTFGLPPE